MSQKPSIKPGRLSIVLLVSSTLVAIVAQLFVALPARADCVDENGTRYKTDTIHRGQVCMPDGNWEPA